jgi:hypothetical protein
MKAPAMSSYTITITPDDTTRASTTLRVDVSDNAARITELLVRAGAAAGLSAHQLPAVDLDLLLRAVMPAGPKSIPATASESLRAGSPAPTPRRRRAGKSAEPAAGAKRTGKRAAKGGSGAEQPTTKARAAKGGAKAAGRGERAYRRAPADLVEVYGQLGGVTAVARHYQVPRYTAQSWIRRLRNEGQLPAGR